MDRSLLSADFDGVKYKWVLSQLRSPPYGNSVWSIASNVTVAGVGLLSRVLLNYMNKNVCYNKHHLLKALKDRKKDVPLITVSNHLSCFDDPGIWGFLDQNHFTYKKMRWALAADNICFINKFYSYFFMLGKCIPVVRGAGVYQSTDEKDNMV